MLPRYCKISVIPKSKQDFICIEEPVCWHEYIVSID